MIAAARETGLTPPLPTPAIGPGLLLDGDPLAGHLFLQGEVRRGETPRALRRRRRTRLHAGQLARPIRRARLDPDLAAFFASIGGIARPRRRRGPDSRRQRQLRSGGSPSTASRVALERPDFHVFGTAPAVGGAAQLVAALRSALGSARSES